jgi:hypothetical protein
LCRNCFTSRNTGSSGPTRIRSWFTQNLHKVCPQIWSHSEIYNLRNGVNIQFQEYRVYVRECQNLTVFCTAGMLCPPQ